MKGPGASTDVDKAVDKAEVLMRQRNLRRAKIWSKLRAYLVRLHNRYLHFTQLPIYSFSSHSLHLIMSVLEINTVDRLDRPSAYYVGKVSR